MGWTVRGLNLGRVKRFHVLQNRPYRLWGPPCLLFNGYRGSSPDVKRPGCEFDHSPPPSAEIKNGWIYTSPPLYVVMARTGTNLTFLRCQGCCPLLCDWYLHTAPLPLLFFPPLPLTPLLCSFFVSHSLPSSLSSSLVCEPYYFNYARLSSPSFHSSSFPFLLMYVTIAITCYSLFSFFSVPSSPSPRCSLS